MQVKHVCMLPEQPFCNDLAPTAGFFRWQLCRIRQMMLPCEWHHGNEFYIRSRKNLLMERQRQMQSGCWIIWHPYSPIKIYWDFFTLILNLVVFLYMPTQVFFICPNRYDSFILLCDFVAFIDIFTKFITGYKNEDSKLVILNLTDIAMRYIRGNFIMDLIGALPLQVYQLHAHCEYPTHTVMFLFKLARLFSMKNAWVNVYNQLNLSYVSTVAAEVFVRIILFFHWLTYMHYQVPAFFSHYYNRKIVWGKHLQLKIENHEIFKKYTANLYWVCGLCVGAGYHSPRDDYIIPDLLLTSGIGIVGLLFIVNSFTSLLRLFMYGQYDKYGYNGRLKDLEEYMRFKHLPIQLKRKILLFLNYKFHGSYFNEKAIHDTINDQIKLDINIHSCKRLVTNIPVFQDMPIAFINMIIFSLVEALFMPGETITSCGEPMDCLYLISSGTVSVLNSVGKEITHLRDGAFFGEDALFDPTKVRTTTIIALEITELYKLSYEAYRACAGRYPHLRKRASQLYTGRDSRSGLSQD